MENEQALLALKRNYDIMFDNYKTTTLLMSKEEIFDSSETTALILNFGFMLNMLLDDIDVYNGSIYDHAVNNLAECKYLDVIIKDYYEASNDAFEFCESMYYLASCIKND